MATIYFKCPTCEAEHRRGFVDGVSVFRCLRCGYMGYGFHSDPDIDRGVRADIDEANACNRALGIPEERPFEAPHT